MSLLDTDLANDVLQLQKEYADYIDTVKFVMHDNYEKLVKPTIEASQWVMDHIIIKESRKSSVNLFEDVLNNSYVLRELIISPDAELSKDHQKQLTSRGINWLYTYYNSIFPDEKQIWECPVLTTLTSSLYTTTEYRPQLSYGHQRSQLESIKMLNSIMHEFLKLSNSYVDDVESLLCLYPMYNNIAKNNCIDPIAISNIFIFKNVIDIPACVYSDITDSWVFPYALVIICESPNLSYQSQLTLNHLHHTYNEQHKTYESVMTQLSKAIYDSHYR